MDKRELCEADVWTNYIATAIAGGTTLYKARSCPESGTGLLHRFPGRGPRVDRPAQIYSQRRSSTVSQTQPPPLPVVYAKDNPHSVGAGRRLNMPKRWICRWSTAPTF